MSTIHTDVTNTTSHGFNAMDALLKNWKDPEETQVSDEDEEEADDVKPKKETQADTETEDQQDEEPDEELEDPDESPDPEEPKSKKQLKIADDDAMVSHKVNGEDKQVSVKELKRLFGQEAALTQKSQAIAAKEKQTEEKLTNYVTKLSTLVTRAEEAYKPYSQIDMLIASKEMTTEEFSAVRAEAKALEDNLNYLREELNGASDTQRQAQTVKFQEAASEAIKVLSDPKTGIEGWGPELYNDLRTFATEGGMPVEAFNLITDPAAIKFLHMAMSYAKVKKVATAKKATAPKKVLTNSRSSNNSTVDTTAKSAMSKLKASGNRDDAASLLMSRWAEAAE